MSKFDLPYEEAEKIKLGGIKQETEMEALEEIFTTVISGWVSEICQQFKAEQVHTIGQVACFYRRNKKKPVIELPSRSAKN